MSRLTVQEHDLPLTFTTLKTCARLPFCPWTIPLAPFPAVLIS